MSEFGDFHFHAENDPEAFEDEPAPVFHPDEDSMDFDTMRDWYAPGYPTAMDEMNALEADDYRDELSDFDGEDF